MSGARPTKHHRAHANTHRRLQSELASFHDMLVAIRTNVAKLKRQGRSLDETIAKS